MTTAEKIKHLFWRAGFGLSPQEWQRVQSWSLPQAIDHLFATAKGASPLEEPRILGDKSNEEIKKLRANKTKALKELAREKVAEQNVAWVGRMADPQESPLLERVCLFWHGHFACELKMPLLAARQMNTLRQHGLGSFRQLVQAMAKDVAMIRYLNNQQNRKRQPNENFARELMELFTIGRGNYSEEEVKEAARAFTGWSSDLRGDYVFRQRQHDYGTKRFMGRSGNFDGDEIVEMILEKEATADFICRKIYRYFVNENVDETILQKLSRDFYQSDYDIGGLLRQIFSSDWFYTEQNVGTKIKSPIDLVAGMMRSLEVQFTQTKSLIFAQKALGQVLFRPPNVAGWPGGKNWIDNATLMLRLNLASYLYHAAEVAFDDKDLKAAQPNRRIKRLEAQTNFTPLIQAFRGQSENAIFAGLQSYFLQAPNSHRKTDIDPFVLKSHDEDYIKSLSLRLMSLPEYQLC